MSRTNSEKWDRLQQLGRSQFVFRYGVLGFGLATATLFVLVQGYLHGVTAALFQLVPAFILFPLGADMPGGGLCGGFLEVPRADVDDRCVVSSVDRIKKSWETGR